MEFKSINQLKSLLDENKISVKEIAQTYINKIKEKKDLNIFIYFDEDKINNQVKEIEKARCVTAFLYSCNYIVILYFFWDRHYYEIRMYTHT